MDREAIERSIRQIRLRAFDTNRPVQIDALPSGFSVVGVGTDAIVVRWEDEKDKVFKVYSPENREKKEIEFQVYQELKELPYFATCYFQGDNYLCLSYEDGPTLYHCLVNGIEIPQQVIQEVDDACEAIRQRSLRPRDIHLKNVILQDGHSKLIDVAEYAHPEEDHRWQHLSQAYRDYYPLVRGKHVPEWIIESVKKLYFQQEGEDFSLSEFVRRLPRFVPFK